jgi:hypothetical protein
MLARVTEANAEAYLHLAGFGAAYAGGTARTGRFGPLLG